MMIMVKNILRFLYGWLIVKPCAVWKLLHYKSQYYGETYYPELPSKSAFRIFLDQLKHIVQYNCFNEYYYLYGLDIRHFRKTNDYLDYNVFMQRRDYLNNHPWGENFSYTGILHDKFYFSVFMEQMGFKVPKTAALIKNGQLFMFKCHGVVDWDFLLDDDKELIGKPLKGIGGIGIFHLKVRDKILYCNGQKCSLDEFKKKIGTDYFLLQEYIKEQHSIVHRLYPKCINTLRITTVRNLKTDKIEVLGRMFLMGARDSIVSNWHYGGVIINVDKHGVLDKYGFSLYEKRILKHPDTGIAFEGIKLPYFEEALEAAISCHGMFYGIHSIGWDFAILPNGILFIEGNDDWGMAAHQMVDKGLAKLFKEKFY